MHQKGRADVGDQVAGPAYEVGRAGLFHGPDAEDDQVGIAGLPPDDTGEGGPIDGVVDDLDGCRQALIFEELEQVAPHPVHHGTAVQQNQYARLGLLPFFRGHQILENGEGERRVVVAPPPPDVDSLLPAEAPLLVVVEQQHVVVEGPEVVQKVGELGRIAAVPRPSHQHGVGLQPGETVHLGDALHARVDVAAPQPAAEDPSQRLLALVLVLFTFGEQDPTVL